MKVWHSSSSDRRPCIICGKVTGTWKVYEQCNMEVRVPLCDNNEEDACYRKVDVKSMTSRFLTDLKKTIQKGTES